MRVVLIRLFADRWASGVAIPRKRPVRTHLRPLFTRAAGLADPSPLADALRRLLFLLKLGAGVGDGVVDVRAEAVLAH